MINSLKSMKKCSPIINNFDDLPPRVVIFKILTYHLMKIPSKDVKPLDLFGYFKKDGMRNIWWLFRSINIEENNDESSIRSRITDICVNFSRLHSLNLLFDYCPHNSEVVERILQTVRNESCRMKNLKNLSIERVHYGDDKLVFDDLFSREGCFPALTSLDINCHSNLIWNFIEEDEEERQMPKFQFKLTMLSLQYEFHRGDGQIFDNYMFKHQYESLSNLKVLSLSIHHENRTRVILPHLEYLDMYSCLNISIVPGENLKYMKIVEMESTIFRETLEMSKNLEVLHLKSISWNGGFDHIWFLNKDFNPLRKLQRLQIPKLTGFTNFENVKTFITAPSFIRRIKKLEVLFSPGMEVIGDSILSVKKFHDLNVLRFSQLSFSSRTVSGMDPHSLSGLTSLILNEVNFNSDDFFVTTHFEDLKSLMICSRYNQMMHPQLLDKLIGIGWNSSISSNLVSLGLHSLHNFEEDFFVSQDFNSIVSLEIRGLIKFAGKCKWSSSLRKNVKELILGDMHLFGDSFFQKNELQQVEIVKLFGLNMMRGLGWKEMTNLKQFSAILCIKFEDSVFLSLKDLGVVVKRY